MMFRSVSGAVWIMLTIASAAILVALASEHWGGLRPCMLCLQQRWAYYAAIPILCLILYLRRFMRVRLGVFILLGLVAILFALNAVLGFYHAGAEYGFWAAPSGCVAVEAVPQSIENLLNALERRPAPSCDEAAWRLFGISFAGYNMLVSFVLAAYAGVIISRHKK